MRGNSNAALRGDPIQRLADGPMAPEPEVLEHPVVRAAAGIAAGLLLPQAATVEEAGVPPSHLRALANGGLVDLLDQPIAVQRVVAELLGGACGSTWFVWAQHQGVLRTVAASDGRFRAELLDGLRAGEPWGSLAYSHLRRPWALQVTLASQADGTSRVSGSLDWVTGWGLATLLLIAAVEEHGTRQEVHWVAFPADRLGELNPGRELRTLAMSGSRTRPVLLPDLHLTPMDVVTSMPMGAWRAEDAIRAATPNPAAFGLMRSVLTDLTEWASSSDRDALPTILALAREAEELRRTAYDLVDATTADPAATGASGAMTADGEPAEHVVARRLELRGRQLALLQRVAALNVAVGGGAAVTMGTTAERWLREAAFHMVQGQTAALRRALVTGLGTSPSA